MDYSELTASLGFPIVATLGIAIGFYKYLNNVMDESSRRESVYHEHIEKFSNTLNEFNKTLALINQDLADVKDDVSEIKSSISRQAKN